MPLLKVTRDQPSFTTVRDMIQHEIDPDDGSICYRNVVSNNIKGNKENELRWKTWYDFARRAAVVMRLHMLEATNMLRHCRQTGTAAQQHLPDLEPEQNGDRFDVTADPDEAREITRQFDHIFEPALLKQRFGTLELSQTRPFGPLDGPILHLIDFPNSQRYEICAHLTVTLMDESEQGLVVTARPFVSVLKCTFHLRPNGDHPRYDELNRFLEDQEQELEFLNQGFAQLNIPAAEGGD